MKNQFFGFRTARITLLLCAFLCSQQTPIQAVNTELPHWAPKAALASAAVMFHQATSRNDFDLFHNHLPQNRLAFACATLLFLYLVLECHASFDGPGGVHINFRFFVSAIGLLGTMLNPCSWRFIVPFVAFVIIALQRKLTAARVANN